MVRKTIIFLLVTLALLSALPISASASTYSVYTQGNISTTYLSYFEDVVNKLGITDHYVFFRSGNNEYTLLASPDLQLIDSTFLCDSPKVYQIYTIQGDGYTTTYNFRHFTDGATVLNVGSSFVFSDLGDYPDLVDRGDYYEVVISFVLCVAFFYFIAFLILRWGKRKYR